LARKRKAKSGDDPILATNRSASFEFHLLKRVEAGLVLTGPEVKSARARRVNLKDAYARIKDGEAYLVNAHFSPYGNARPEDCEPRRPRKLLLHAREIRKLARETDSSGVTIVPTKLYLKQGRIKVELALAKGKRQYDKREAKMKRDVERELARARD